MGSKPERRVVMVAVTSSWYRSPNVRPDYGTVTGYDREVYHVVLAGGPGFLPREPAEGELMILEKGPTFTREQAATMPGLHYREFWRIVDEE
jgi:hypothetical protein